MTTVSLQDLQRDPAGLLDRVEAGECLVVARDSRPAAELRPLALATREPRPYGLDAGEFAVPDDFDAPLPDELLGAFEGLCQRRVMTIRRSWPPDPTTTPSHLP